MSEPESLGLLYLNFQNLKIQISWPFYFIDLPYFIQFRASISEAVLLDRHYEVPFEFYELLNYIICGIIVISKKLII